MFFIPSRLGCLSLIGCLLHFAVPSCAAGASPERAVEPNKGAHSSLWGPATGGVQMRVRGPVRVEERTLLPLSIEFLSDPDRLPQEQTKPGGRAGAADRLDVFLFPGYVSLTLVNLETKEQFTVQPHDPASGMPARDAGDHFITLNGKTSEPITVEFPLLSAGEHLLAGAYDCTVTYDSGRGRPEWKAGGAAAEGFWGGQVSSAPLRLQVVAESERAQEFMVPTRLHLADGQVRFGTEDSEKVKLPVRNGYFTGMTVNRLNGPGMLTNAGFDAEHMTVEDLSGDPVIPKGAGLGDRKLTYTIEIFETSKPPGHGWLPAPGMDGYKTLWKRVFEVGAGPAPVSNGRQ